MRTLLVLAISLMVASAADAQTVIGNFAGGVAETGWGRFNNGVQPLDSNVFAVSDLDTSGDGGALETNLAGFSDSFGYSFSDAGTEADFFANDTLVFDVIYRGTPTNSAEGGFSQIFQVLFQSDFDNFALTSFQSNADGVPLNQFGGGGTAVGWAPGDAGVQSVLNVEIDYSAFKDTLPNGFDPSVLQFWMSTNDDNRVFKAIDNVRLTGAIPEPSSVALLVLAGICLAGAVRPSAK